MPRPLTFDHSCSGFTLSMDKLMGRWYWKIKFNYCDQTYDVMIPSGCKNRSEVAEQARVVMWIDGDWFMCETEQQRKERVKDIAEHSDKLESEVDPQELPEVLDAHKCSGYHLMWEDAVQNRINEAIDRWMSIQYIIQLEHLY